MVVELNAEQERIVQEQISSGRFQTPGDVTASALAHLPRDRRFDSDSRREAVRRMLAFSQRNLSLGEPITRRLLHEGHRR